MGADLWGVTFVLVEDRYRAVCYLCDWRGEPVEHECDAEPEMASHLRSPQHRAVLCGDR